MHILMYIYIYIYIHILNYAYTQVIAHSAWVPFSVCLHCAVGLRAGTGHGLETHFCGVWADWRLPTDHWV